MEFILSNYRSPNTFVYQATLDTLELIKDKDTDYNFSKKSKIVFHSKLKPLYIAFLHSIKFSEHCTEIKFYKKPLAVEENNYLRKIVKFT